MPGLGARLIAELASPLPWLLIDRWSQELSGPQTIRAAIEGVCWHEDSDVAGQPQGTHRGHRSADSGRRLSPAAREDWFVRVRDRLTPE